MIWIKIRTRLNALAWITASVLVIYTLPLSSADETPFQTVKAQFDAGSSAVSKATTRAETAKGVEQLQSALSGGYAPAATQLAFLHMRGLHIEKDIERAQQLYEFAIAQGDSLATQQYAIEFLPGGRLPSDAPRARELLMKAARLGHSTSQLLLADELQRDEDPQAQALAEKLRDSLNDEFRHYSSVLLAIIYRFDGTAKNAESQFAYWLQQVPEDQRAALVVDVVSQRALERPINMDPALTLALLDEFADWQSPGMMNSYAWMLATCANPRLRDGARAIKLLEPVRETVNETAYFVDTLAAAYAADGQFARAAATQERALVLLGKSDPALPEARERLALYEAGESWFE